MADSPIGKLLDQALEKAGYAYSGLKEGAREKLAQHVEELTDKHGYGTAFTAAKTFMVSKNEADQEESAPNPENLPVVHRCMKESGAAAMAAIIKGAANSVQYWNNVRSGEMNVKEAMSKIIGETVSSAADSAVKAAGETGKQILIEKYGTEENAIKSLASQGFTAVQENIPLPGGSSKIVTQISQILDLATGKKSENCEIPGIVTEQGARMFMPEVQLGNAAGKGVINLLKSHMPPNFKGIPTHPVFLIASMIAVTAGKIAIKNCIERPFQDLARNTSTLNAACAELERVSRTMCKGQRLFGEFVVSDAKMETALKNQMSRIDKAQQSALDEILKI